MAFKKTQIEIIPGHSVLVDAEDVGRIQGRSWRVIPGPNFVTNLGTPANPVYQFLQGFVLGVKPSQYVEQIDRTPSGLRDYRKRNLRTR